jgi:hypothetical protein
VVVVLVLTLLGLTPALAHHSVLTIDLPSALSEDVYGQTGFVAVNDRGHVLAYDFVAREAALITNPTALTPTRQAIACPQFPPNMTYAHALNRLMDVVGTCERVGFLRTAAGAYRLLTAPGAFATEATGINHLRQVVGSSQEGEYEGIFRGFRWQQGRFTPLTLPWPDVKHVLPYAINGLGDIVGIYIDTEQSETYPFGRGHGFLIRNGAAMLLEVPGEDVVLTVPQDVNELGQVLGVFLRATDTHATPFLWEQGTFRAIPLPDPPNAGTDLFGLNRHGVVAGVRTLINPSQPTAPPYYRGVLSIWSPDHATILASGAPATARVASTTSTLRAVSLAPADQDMQATGMLAMCAQAKASGLPLLGRTKALALLCGER